MIRLVLRTTAYFVLLALIAPLLHAAERPNIVLILADDLGYGDPGCYNTESKIPTPHIDRLATEGMRFTDAHSPSSVCSPTRYGLLTGRYCWRTELKRSVLWPWDGPLIEPERLTLPKMLGRLGYETACIGKWHLGWDWPTRDGSRINDTLALGQYDAKIRTAYSSKIDFSRTLAGGPTARGFDYYFGDDVPNFPPYTFFENDRLLGTPNEPKPEGMFGHPGPMQPGWDLSAVMPALADKAVAFLEKPRERPFFLYMPLTAPHTPIAPRPEFAGKSRAGRYGDFVAQVDATVGQVLAALDRAGLSDDTLVLFTSDNGSPARDGTNMSGPTRSVVEQFGHDPSRPWRGMKSDIWEAGHRVPFVIRWPDHVESNTTSGALICLTDCFATLAAVLGEELPEDAAEDSFNFLLALTGEQHDAPLRKSIVHHSGNGTFAVREGDWKLIVGNLASGGFTRPSQIDPTPDGPQGQLHHLGTRTFAVREGDWKLIVGNLASGGFTRPSQIDPTPDGPQGQLYNLEADPGEQRNLWLERPDVVERLETLLEEIKSDGGSHPAASQ